jgi:DNA-binding GntR family transcriptional regulator
MAMSAQDMTYKWLKNRIAALPRHEGTFLTEAEVAAESGVSRTPVREALLRLEVEGLVQILPKKGAFVPPVSDAEVEATMQARMLVERWAATKVTAAGESIDVPLDELLAEQLQLLDEDDSGAFIDADRRFHRVIVQAAGNPVLNDFYESLRDRQIRMGLRAVTSRPDRGQAVIDEHTAIRDALASRDAERADEAVKAHLTNTLEVLRLPTALLGVTQTASRGKKHK